jgi:hypothetical protein
MKNGFVLLMVLALIGGASAQCLTGPIWGLALTENPYTFSTDADPFVGTDCWGGWDGGYGDDRNYTSGGLLYLDTNEPEDPFDYIIVFNHDNDVDDLWVTPGVDKIELVVWVDSISPGANAIVKIEQYPASDDSGVASFPNRDDGTGAIVTDAWDPDTTITGPGQYHFFTAAPADVNTVAVTPVIGVANGSIVIDAIWIGTESSPCAGTAKASNSNPANNSIQPSGSVTQLEWILPGSCGGSSDLTVDLRFEQELGIDGEGNYVYDPNWGAANGTPTVMVTNSGINMTSQSVSELAPYTSPLPDGLYSWRVDVTDPSPVGGGTTEGNVWLLVVSDCYNIDLEGDLDNNCRVDLADFALLAANWLLDCIDDPANPGCVTP